jgi:hypothetical protein
MYIQASEGLGQYTITRNGHRRVKWSKCSKFGPRQRLCGVTLNVKFRHSFEDFRKQLEQAFRTWMTPPRARMLTEKYEDRLRAIHKHEMDKKLPDNTPFPLLGYFVYRGPDGPKQEWRIVDFLDDTILFGL